MRRGFFVGVFNGESITDRWGVLVIVSFLLFVFWNLVFSPELALAVCSSDIEGKSDAQLATMLADCEAEIASEKAKLTEVQKDATELEAGIAELNYKIRKAELDIKARNIKIAQLGDDINVRGTRISTYEQRIDNIKLSLGELVRKTNELENFTPVEAMLSGQDLSDFFIDLDDFNVVKNNLQASLIEIKDLHIATKSEKELLEEREEKEREERYLRQKDKDQTELFKDEKERILDVTRKEEKAYKDVIAEKERAKAQIRSRLFRTVSGFELTFGEALDLVRKYESRIGINPALVLAVLTQESAVDGLIGKNIGKCYYNQSAPNKSGTVMSNSQKESFLAITSELGLNPNTTPVSCPIVSDGAYGGASGPAQFMPNTWWNVKTSTGYKKRVAKVTGVAVPSPFIPEHAFAGTALYLSDALERCLTAFTSTFELRACSAAKYYSGLGSRGSRLYRHMNPRYSYGYKVATRAAQFAKDIDTLDR